MFTASKGQSGYRPPARARGASRRLRRRSHFTTNQTDKSGRTYKAHALAAFVRAAAQADACGGGLMLDYAELPGAIWTRLAAHFGLRLDGHAVERMQAVSGRHSKRPAEVFSMAQDPGRGGSPAFRATAAPAAAALAALRAP